MASAQPPRVAIVHDWLVHFAGSESVVASLLDLYPHADLFSVVDVLDDTARARLAGRRATTSFVQHLPFVRTKYRSYLPLMPLAVEQWDLSPYDLVISSSHAVAKGVITGPDQLHVAYVHSPMRYAWDLQHEYLRQANVRWGPAGILTRYLLHRLRAWDAASGLRPDVLVANSSFIARRIEKVYRRPSTVVHPPVDVEAFDLPNTRSTDTYYVTASRFVPYKRVDVIVEAFAKMPDRKLVVIGDGPDHAKIAKVATRNVHLLGHVPLEVLRSTVQQAAAFVFAAEEDFGIAPVEAQATGTPVIAFGKGGVRDSVVASGASPTGLFFGAQTPESIREAVTRFERMRDRFDPLAARANAMRFSRASFRSRMQAVIDDAVRARDDDRS